MLFISTKKHTYVYLYIHEIEHRVSKYEMNGGHLCMTRTNKLYFQSRLCLSGHSKNENCDVGGYYLNTAI